MEQPGLYRLVRELSTAGRLPVPRLYLSPAKQPNAFTVGRAPRAAAVCCTEGLLAALDETELRAVLGHELAHVSGRDILPGTVSAGLATLITFPAGVARFLPIRAAAAPSGSAPSGSAPSGSAPSGSAPSGSAPSGSAPSGSAPSGSAPSGSVSARGTAGSGLGLLEATLMLVLGPIAALVIRLTATPAAEFRADAAGALLSGEPVALASALRKIDAGTAELALAPDGRLTSVGHLMIASPFRADGFAALFRTHPPAGERVRRLEALAGYRRLPSAAAASCAAGASRPLLSAPSKVVQLRFHYAAERGGEGPRTVPQADTLRKEVMKLPVVDELQGEVEFLAFQQGDDRLQVVLLLG